MWNSFSTYKGTGSIIYGGSGKKTNTNDTKNHKQRTYRMKEKQRDATRSQKI
jgi:hypothetical protein